MASSLAARLIGSIDKKTSRSTILQDSAYFGKEGMVVHEVPIMSVMHSGVLGSGISYGSTMVVGDSRTFKSNFCLKIVSEFLKKYSDAMCIFVDTEFGSSAAYFETFDIDTSRVIHVPVENIEQMNFELNKMLAEVGDKDRVIVFIDSISQAASKKEATDAVEGNSVADMTRARSLNSFWRVINPIINLKKIPLLAINSYYDDIGNKYAEKNIKGGKQGFLSADTVWFVTRAKEKDADGDLAGWTFNYKAMKSRFVRENSVFPIRVTFDQGIDKYSGLFDLMKDGGFITMPTNAWYNIGDVSGLPPLPSNVRKADITTPAVMDAILATKEFKKYIYELYSMSSTGSAAPMAPSGKVDNDSGEIAST